MLLDLEAALEETQVPQYTERINVAVEQIQGPRVLHLGCCGTELPKTAGDRSRWLHGALVDAGVSVLGGDINHRALDEMRANGYEVTYLDAQAIPPDGEKFNTIIAGELIEHLENPGLLLTGARQRLLPNGHLVLTTPNVFCPVYFAGNVVQYKRIANPEHTCWFDPQTLEQLLTRTGYRVEGIWFASNMASNVPANRYTYASKAWKRISTLLPQRFQTNLIVKAMAQS